MSILLTVLSCASTENNHHDASGMRIHVNQVGYYTDAPKLFTVVNTSADSFTIQDEHGTTVHTGPLSDNGYYDASGEHVKTGDFTDLQTPGTYIIRVGTAAAPHPCIIGNGIYKGALYGTVRSYYYQRCSMQLDEAYAGRWSRPAGHPDTNVTFHPSTGKSGQTSSPGGWYDAGDYGKYVVNGGITVCTLLALYELYPDAVTDDCSIPESGNGRSDLLDEVQYELDWFKTMQDTDGGVFFKLGTLSWPGQVMPHEDNLPRFIIGKSTASTLNFCAAMAMAGRIYRDTDREYAQDCTSRALSAWEWAQANPGVLHPDETGGTGPYSDTDFSDEFLAAAAELYITTQESTYLDYIREHIRPFEITGIVWWGDLRNLAFHSIAVHGGLFPDDVARPVQDAVLQWANTIVARIEENPYRIPLEKEDFVWGSTGVAANYGASLCYAYYLSGDDRYLDAAIKTADYIFGRNATGYSFVTGYGVKPPMHPHHRPSEADEIDDPVPGLVVGGANQYREDKADYPHTRPARSYVDSVESYASNENAVNQNAPVVFLLGVLEANK